MLRKDPRESAGGSITSIGFGGQSNYKILRLYEYIHYQ